MGVASTDQLAIREQLGDAFPKIRFPTMSLQEFSYIAGKSDILTCSEKSSIYYYIGTKDNGNNTLAFNWRPRYNENMLDRFRTTVNSSWGCSYQWDAIQFKTDKNITLTAIGTYPNVPNGVSYYTGYSYVTSTSSSFDLSVNITAMPQVYQGLYLPPVNKMTTVSVNSTLADDKGIIKVPLNDTVEIKAGVQYIISVRQIVGNGCYSKYGQTSTPYDPVKIDNVTVWFYNPGTTSTSTSSGQIPRLYFITM
jgi:hypothetical protein